CRNIDERGLELFGVGVAKLDVRQRFEMLVEQPGMVDRRLQDQRLPAWDCGAAAQERACGELWARHDIAPLIGAWGAASRARAGGGGGGMAKSGEVGVCGRAFAPYWLLVIRCCPLARMVDPTSVAHRRTAAATGRRNRADNICARSRRRCRR